jgi:hypothetical protein
MAVSSINFAKSSGGSFAHNDRTEKEPAYLLPVEHRLENECDRSALEAQKMLEDLFENAKENYQKTYGQKFQTKFENVHWEAVINLNKEHTIKDVERLVREIEKETGFTAVQISIHRDEGRINEKTGHPIHNLHAHVNFFTLDPKTGQQLYRRSISNSEREKIRKEHDIPDGEKIPRHLTGVMDKAKLSKLQDITAKALGMERGERGSTKVRLGHKQHRAVEQEKEKLLEKIDELQKENAELRYNFRDMQKQITALEITPEEKKELHRLNTEINKIKGESAEKDEKIKILEKGIIPKNLHELYDKTKGMERLEIHKQMTAIVGKSDGVEVGHLTKMLELSENENKSLKEMLKEQGKDAQFETKNKALEAEIKTLKEIVEEKFKPLETIYQENDEQMIRIFGEKVEKVEIKTKLFSKAETVQVVTLDNFNAALPKIREANKKMVHQLSANAPRIVDNQSVERLTKERDELAKELHAERGKNIELSVKLEQLQKTVKEVWGNVKEAFRYEGSRLQSEIGNLLDFSRKIQKENERNPNEPEKTKSKGIER